MKTTVVVALKKIRRNLVDFGIRGTLTKGIQYLLKTVYQNRTYRIYCRDVSTGEFPEAHLQGLEMRIVGNDEIQVMRQIEAMEEWLVGMLPEIMSHGLCIAAFDGSRVVGFNVIAFDEVFIVLINLKKRLRPNEAWSEQITVLKDYRKQGLASALRYRAFAELQRRGIRKFYGGTLDSNIPSQKTAQKVGFHFVADVQYKKILKRERRVFKRVKHVNP